MAIYAFRGVFQNPCSRMGTKLKLELPPPPPPRDLYIKLLFFILIISVSLYWEPHYFTGKLPVAHISTKLTCTLHCTAYFIVKALRIKRGATKGCICIGSLHCSGACVEDNRKESKHLLIRVCSQERKEDIKFKIMRTYRSCHTK